VGITMSLSSHCFTLPAETVVKRSAILVMVCIYVFLCIERPWESIRYLDGLPIERGFALLMILVAVMTGRFKVKSSAANVWVYGLLALHFLLAPFAYNSGYAVDQGIEYAKMAVLYLLMLTVVDDRDSLDILLKAFIFSMMVYTLHSLWEYHNGRYVWRMGITRMVGVDRTFSDPNAFGASVVLSVPIAYALLRSETRPKLRRLYYLYFAMVVTCVVLTGSRSASVALVFLILLWAALQKGRRKVWIFSLAIISLAIVWSVMPAEKQERISSIWDKDAGPANAQKSSEGRWLGFDAGWQMFRKQPFTGMGAGGKNFVEYRLNYLDGIPEQPHNLYAQVLGGMGLLGGVFFTGLVVSTWRACLKVRRELRFRVEGTSYYYDVSGAIIITLVLLLLLGVAGHNFYRPHWFWLAAWASCLVRQLPEATTALSLAEPGTTSSETCLGQ
jgi:O-antigen ligase